jgi:membrane-associated phospholipid phosphatase
MKRGEYRMAKASDEDDSSGPPQPGFTEVGPNDLPAPPAQPNLRARVFQVSFSAALLFYTLLAVAARARAYFACDVSIAERIQMISLPGFDHLMIWISWLGGGVPPVALAVLAGLGLALAGLRSEAVVCSFGTAMGSGVDSLLKLLSNRPRPAPPLVHVMKHYQHQSFPSGHVFFFVEFFGFLLFLTYVLLRPVPLRLVLVILLSCLIILVGISRVYLGAHWPSDVAGGYLGGGIWLSLMIVAYRRLKKPPARLPLPLQSDTPG